MLEWCCRVNLCHSPSRKPLLYGVRGDDRLGEQLSRSPAFSVLTGGKGRACRCLSRSSVSRDAAFSVGSFRERAVRACLACHGCVPSINHNPAQRLAGSSIVLGRPLAPSQGGVPVAASQ